MSIMDQLRNDPLAFMKKYSLAPDDQAQGYTHHRKDNLGGLFKLEIDEIGTTKPVPHCTVGDPVAWVNLQKKVSFGRGHIVVMTASVGRREGWIPTYFLPWDPSGAIVEINIPKPRAAFTGESHPKMFFTATLSGCSIFVKGSRESPTILHCGTSFSTPQDIPSAQYWSNILDVAETFGASNAYQQRRAEVHAADYMQPKRGNAGAGVQHAGTFKGSLDRYYGGSELAIDAVLPWGTFFGIREGDKWTFYLQENAAIRIRKADGTFFETSRPMVVRKIYPGSGTATVKTTWQSIRSQMDKVQKAFAAAQGSRPIIQLL